MWQVICCYILYAGTCKQMLQNGYILCIKVVALDKLYDYAAFSMWFTAEAKIFLFSEAHRLNLGPSPFSG